MVESMRIMTVLVFGGLRMGFTLGLVTLSLPAFAESVPLAEPPAGPEPAASDGDATTNSDAVNLTLPELLSLTLEGNRELRNQALERIVQRQQLAAAEQTFSPRFTPTIRADAARSQFGGGVTNEIPGSLLLGGDRTDFDQEVRLDTALTTRLGTRFEVGLTPFEGGQSLQFRVSQPLLRGFGRAVNEAPVNQARLGKSKS